MRDITDGTSRTVMLGELRSGTSPVDRRTAPGQWVLSAPSSLTGVYGTSDALMVPRRH